MPRKQRLRILTWHVHGNYLYYLTQVPHDFVVPCDAGRSPGYAGRTGTLPWGDNLIEVPVEELGKVEADCVLYQSRSVWETRDLLLTPAQLALPRIYLEHDPPQEHPTNTQHPVQDRGALLVHVTAFNRLMWDNGVTPAAVIEHGVKLLADTRYSGTLPRGVVVVNNLRRRGRRLGLDVYEQVRRSIPLDLYGMDSLAVAGGLGEVENSELPARMARYRFFFNPIRWTSLGLSVVEAMMVGLPIVALATTEMSSVVRDGVNGYVDTRVEELIEGMQALIADPAAARALGAAARRDAMARFSIGRFVDDWCRTLAFVTG